MYVYGAFTAPNPDRIPIIVTPITPTLLMGCSIENIPKLKNIITKISMYMYKV